MSVVCMHMNGKSNWYIWEECVPKVDDKTLKQELLIGQKNKMSIYHHRPQITLYYLDVNKYRR